MQTLTCKTCKHITAISAKACPNCGEQKPFAGVKLTIEETKELKARERKSFILAGGKITYSKKMYLSIGISFAVIAGVVSVKSPSSEEQAADDLERKALSVCRASIDQRLKYPSSAKYSYEPLDRVALKKPDGTWLVQRGLTSKNGFGVMVPSKFGCDITQQGEKMTVVKLEQYK